MRSTGFRLRFPASEFSVFDAERPGHRLHGQTERNVRSTKTEVALAEVLRRWRIVVAAKGHELAPGSRRRDSLGPYSPRQHGTGAGLPSDAEVQVAQYNHRGYSISISIKRFDDKVKSRRRLSCQRTLTTETATDP